MSMNFGNFSPSNFQSCLASNNLSGKLRTGLGTSDRSDSCGNNNFLMISKSRIPDIQMINRYYGLVPKKFAINSRTTDQSSKLSSAKLRAKSAYTFDNSNNNSHKGGRGVRTDSNSFYASSNLANNQDDEKYNDPQTKSHSLQHPGETKSRRKSEVSQNRRGSHSGQVEVVAKKMPVEKYKRWKRAKSLSLMDNNANVNNNSGEKDNRNFQRVIKIDLNNMRWEESYQTKTALAPLSVNENSPNNLDLGTDSRDCGQAIPAECSLQVQNENPTKTTTSSSLISNNDTNNLNNPLVCANGSVTKRGSLRKTISFDEQLLQSTPAENSPSKSDAATGKLRRPMTASTTRSSQNPTNSFKVAPWTTRAGQTTSDRRTKLQKSNSVQSDHDQFSSVDIFGQGESDNEQDPSTDFPSWAYRESRRTLHVQALPEVSTMVSAISPPADEEIQSEIEKVAQMLNNLQSQQKCFSELQANVKSDLVNSESISKSEHQHLICHDHDELKSIQNDKVKVDNENPVENVRNSKCEGNNVDVPSEKAAIAEDVKKVPRRPFKKSVSISCEKELYSTTVAGNQSENPNSNSNGKSCRPKTATSARNITKSSSIGARSNATSGKQSNQLSSEKTNSPDQSQGSKTRKILIKKALIEINQTSTGFGKRVGIMGRPKTAPTPDKKTPTTNITQRQPFKPARSPPSSTAGGKAALPFQKKNTLAQKMEPATPEKVDSEEQKSPISSPEIKHKSLARQSFSLDDGLLLGFSTKEFSRDVNEDIKDAELSFLSSKKREECLKIYEKMMKTGCAIKLDTIFRGMMTPSEYRQFIKAAENAAREAAAEAENGNEVSENDGDAGVPVKPTEDE